MRDNFTNSKRLIIPPLANMGEGVAGLVANMVGYNIASENLQAARRNLCASCKDNNNNSGLLAQCKLCGCIISEKIKRSNGKCPIGKW